MVVLFPRKKKKRLLPGFSPKLFTLFFSTGITTKHTATQKGEAVQTSLHRLPFCTLQPSTRAGKVKSQWRGTCCTWCFFFPLMARRTAFLMVHTWQRGPQQANGPCWPNTKLRSPTYMHTRPKKNSLLKTPGPEEATGPNAQTPNGTAA